jgi:hypothetical protein
MSNKLGKLNSFFKSFADSEEQLDFRMAHETVGQKVPAIPSGSLLLDDALSSGGLPKGRHLHFFWLYRYKGPYLLDNAFFHILLGTVCMYYAVFHCHAKHSDQLFLVFYKTHKL